MRYPRGLFIAAALHSAEDFHCNIYVSEQEQSSLGSALDSFISSFGGKAGFELKLIGCRALISACEDLLAHRGVKTEKTVFRETEMEIFHDLKSGHVRVSKEKIRVLVADDSSTIRRILQKILASDPEVEVVAAAELPSQVEGLILKHRPHVMTLDLHMPEMSGVSLLKKIYPKYLIPTVVVSSISMEEGPLVMEALESGALDYIQKPSMDQINSVGAIILEKIKSFSQAKTRLRTHSSPSGHSTLGRLWNSSHLVAIGSSTGGTEALKSILTRLPPNIPPIVIVQHIPAVFSKAFADRMNELCPFEVKEAQEGDEIIPNRVLVAAGGTQFSVTVKNGKMLAKVTDDAPVNRHKPSVDVLFQSVAKNAPKKSICIILTGMGADGAKGMLEAHAAGARTIAQDEESCAVFGMPKEAIRLGGVERICSLSDIPEQLEKLLNETKAA